VTKSLYGTAPPLSILNGVNELSTFKVRIRALFTDLSCWPHFPRWVADIFPPWPAAGAPWPARPSAAPLQRPQQLHSHSCCCCCYSLRRSLHKGFSPAVLRIHDILVWIRSGSFYFRHWPSRSQQKKVLKNCLFITSFTSFFKDKKSKKKVTK
jgi:hypothetical protein